MTAAAEIAHLFGDTPTAQESVLCPVCLIQIARVMSKRELTGWTFPDRAQAVYIFEGGVTPEDFCYGAG